MKKPSYKWNFFVMVFTGLLILALFQWSLAQRAMVINDQAYHFGLPDPHLSFPYPRKAVEEWEVIIAEQESFEARFIPLQTEAIEKGIDVSTWKPPFSAEGLSKWQEIVEKTLVSSEFIARLSYQAKAVGLELSAIPLPINNTHAGKWSMALDNLMIRPVPEYTGLGIMTTEVTQGLYEVISGVNPSSDPQCGITCPVDRISGVQAASFANLLSQSMGFTACYEVSSSEVTIVQQCNGWRLPTIEQWQSALGDWQQLDLNTIAWGRANAEQKVQPVAEKQPSMSGMFDLLGNVAEWVWSDDKLVMMGGDVSSIPIQMDKPVQILLTEQRAFAGFRLCRTIKK